MARASSDKSRYTDDWVIGEFCVRFARWGREKQAGTIHGLQAIHRCQNNGASVPVEDAPAPAEEPPAPPAAAVDEDLCEICGYTVGRCICGTYDEVEEK